MKGGKVACLLKKKMYIFKIVFEKKKPCVLAVPGRLCRLTFFTGQLQNIGFLIKIIVEHPAEHLAPVNFYKSTGLNNLI